MGQGWEQSAECSHLYHPHTSPLQVQFMGKDNVPFHTVIFPATLLGTGEKWTMMRNIRCVGSHT